MSLSVLEKRNLIALTTISGLGPRGIKKILNRFSASQVFEGEKWSPELLAQAPKLAQSAIDWAYADKILQQESEFSFKLTCFGDKNYPELLCEIPDSPVVLFGKGDLALLQTNQIAIVGARRCSAVGESVTKEFATAFVQAGITVTSGVALGIDSAAHQAALEAKGKTIGVLGCGFNHTYPPENRRLYAQIAEQGLLLSEYHPDQKPEKFHFPHRNRIISGLSKGVLVVEAAEKSGSLITAYTALEQNRDVYAVPGSVRNQNCAGTNKLIQEGAQLVCCPNDIIGGPPDNKVVVINKTNKLEENPLLVHIDDVCTPTDLIVARSGHSAQEISSLLFKLELEGKVVAVAGGYQRA